MLSPVLPLVCSAALLAAAAAAFARAVRRVHPRPFDPAGRGVYAQNRWAAARFGPHGKLIHPDRDEALTAVALVRDLPVAASGLHPESCEADRQLEVGRSLDLQAVCAELVERSVA